MRFQERSFPMALELDQLVEFRLPVNAPTLEPNTGFVFTAEKYEGHPAALSLIIAFSENTREHQQIDDLGATCVFGNGQFGCRWASDDYDDGHLKAVTLELTRIESP
jgi:hypothetical protein